MAQRMACWPWPCIVQQLQDEISAKYFPQFVEGELPTDKNVYGFGLTDEEFKTAELKINAEFPGEEAEYYT